MAKPACSSSPRSRRSRSSGRSRWRSASPSPCPPHRSETAGTISPHSPLPLCREYCRGSRYAAGLSCVNSQNKRKNKNVTVSVFLGSACSGLSYPKITQPLFRL